jgi:hypothetical protein
MSPGLDLVHEAHCKTISRKLYIKFLLRIMYHIIFISFALEYDAV